MEADLGHLVITIHESRISFRHSDGRTGSTPTPNGGTRVEVLDYIRTFIVADTVEILLA